MPEHLCVSTGRGALCEDLTQRQVFLHDFVDSGLAPSLGSAPCAALGHGHSSWWEASDGSQCSLGLKVLNIPRSLQALPFWWGMLRALSLSSAPSSWRSGVEEINPEAGLCVAVPGHHAVSQLVPSAAG